MKNKKISFGSVMFMGLSIAAGMSIGLLMPKLGDHMHETYGMMPALITILGYIIFIIVSLIFASAVHEAGHLVMGLSTGYEFVSYRVLSMIWVREDGKLKHKKYSVPGTLGQCLMTYPLDKDLTKAPFFLYHAGGVIFNILLVAIGMIVFLIADDHAVRIFAFTFALVSMYQALTNGIPFKSSGFPNDAYNIMMIRKDPLNNALVIKQLIQNAEMGKGVELTDLSEDMFEGKDPLSNESIKVAQAMNFACREMQLHRFGEAAEIMEKIYENEEAPKILKYESACELMFLRLIEGGGKEKVNELYTKEVDQYIKQTEKFHIQKKRLMYTYKLIADNDKNAADKEFDLALKMGEGYPLKGEYSADIKLMGYVKEKYSDR